MVNRAPKRYLLPGYSRRRNSYCAMAPRRGFSSLKARPLSASNSATATTLASALLLVGQPVQLLAHALGGFKLRAGLLLPALNIGCEGRSNQQAEHGERRQPAFPSAPHELSRHRLHHPRSPGPEPGSPPKVSPCC